MENLEVQANLLFATNNPYGKKGEDVAIYAKALAAALEEYPIKYIIEALKHWQKNKRGIPEPVDIREIIQSGDVAGAKDYCWLLTWLKILSVDYKENMYDPRKELTNKGKMRLISLCNKAISVKKS